VPTKPLERLLFVQGGRCFFCKQPLPRAEASVEHLVASSHGGSNNDHNCVVCCKSLNALLGSMSLKEKLQVVLNQTGQFRCPRGGSPAAGQEAKAPPETALLRKSKEDDLNRVIANLKQRGNARPRTPKTLTSTVATLFPGGIAPSELDDVIAKLQELGTVSIVDGKVAYAFASGTTDT